jgi:hypothetical protein
MTTALVCMIFSLVIISSKSEDSIHKAPVHQVPFPAITICPETKAQKNLIDFSQAYHNLVKNSSDQEFDETE